MEDSDPVVLHGRNPAVSRQLLRAGQQRSQSPCTRHAGWLSEGRRRSAPRRELRRRRARRGGYCRVRARLTPTYPPPSAVTCPALVATPTGDRASDGVAAAEPQTNAAARDKEEGTHGRHGSDPEWLIGKQTRHRGSLHGDIWRGSAAELASRGCLAVYPAVGWWKTRQALERYDQTARYALIVSIRAPEMDVDLRTEVANQIGVPVEIEN